MTSKLETAEDLETQNIPEEENTFIHQRLRAIYKFALKKIRLERNMSWSENHLDIGTWEGTFVPHLFDFAKNVTSIDINPENLEIARKRNDLKRFSDRLNLLEMTAQNLNFPDNSFDSATIIEVFGAGFKGKEADVEKVIKEVHRTLKPGGILVMTFKSKSYEKGMKAVNELDKKGYPISRKELGPVIHELFGDNFAWYGQVNLKKNKRNEFIDSLKTSADNTSNTIYSFLNQIQMRKQKNEETIYPLIIPGRKQKQGLIYDRLANFAGVLENFAKTPHIGTGFPLEFQNRSRELDQPVWDKNSFTPKIIENPNKQKPVYWVFAGQKPY